MAKSKKANGAADSANGNGSGKPLIVIASNRGPYKFSRGSDGELTYTRGGGGLVTALGGIAEKHDVLWVACAMSEADEDWSKQGKGRPQMIDNTLLQLVPVDDEQYTQFYSVIANPLLWFIQHQLYDTPRQPNIDRETWEAWEHGYCAVNKKMADVIAKSVKDHDGPVIIYPQDYHFYMMPRYLRDALGDKVQIQPFLHIPWPGPDAWRVLPDEMRSALFSSLLQSDRVGFQTRRDAFNFVQTCRFFLSGAHSYGSRDSLEYEGRKVNANAYPISIDVEKVESLSEETETALLKSRLINIVGDNQVILRVDRIEPSKNILRGFQAFRALLRDYPEHRGKVQFLALLVPSRTSVEEYYTYLQETMAEAGLINAEYSTALWEPVRIILGDNYNRAIAAFQIYDVLLVNPIADGMNLVAKEGALVNQRNGVLLLSEHAGAFYELGEHAMAVSPYDIFSTARAMHQALTMPADDRKKQAEVLRSHVRTAGVKVWFENQVNDALDAFNTEAKKDSTPATPSTT